jgi:dolichyl-phosphate-mannose--protein O-mannosyl transferase
MAACAHGWLKKRRFDAMLILTFYLGLYLCWAVIPRAATTYTYYFPAAMMLGVALAYALTHTKLALLPRLSVALAAVCALIFAMFLPISSGNTPATSWIYDHLMWSDQWRWPRPGFCGVDPC